MCGIAGVIGRDREQVEAAVARMTTAMVHRGPDDGGVELRPFGNQWLGLGHRRLSILDLSPLGRQPMAHEASGCCIVFNGEIYNFPILKKQLEAEGERFRSSSDTEVLLAGIALHGPQFIKRLEGMYAFGWFDPRTSTLVLGRDPAGIKPLYVAETQGCFLFASEVRAILAAGLVPRTVSRAAVASLLAYGSVQQPLTMFESVRMNPPGAWRTIRPSGERWQMDSPTVWWVPPEPETIAPDVVNGTREHLNAAVRDHLIADVPVGIFLSAGLDSAVIAGLAAKHSRDLRTFTVAVSDQPAINELALATETAKRLGLVHTPIHLPTTEAEASVKEWLAAADQPSMDGLNTFIISKAVRRHGIKVALSGLGSDELFGGYQAFHDLPKLAWLRRVVGWMPASFRRATARVLTVGRSSVVRDKLTDLLGGPSDIAGLTLNYRRVLSNHQLSELGLSSTDVLIAPNYLPTEAQSWLPDSSVSDPYWITSVTESRFYQTNTLLRDSDANGMAHSLEIRVPFLDQRLLNWVHRLPSAVRFPRGKPPKALLREAVGDLLYADILRRPKTGFTLPIRQWMVGPLRQECETGLAELARSGLVNPAGVAAVWQSFRSDPNSHHTWSRALTLVALGDYLGRHASVSR